MGFYYGSPETGHPPRPPWYAEVLAILVAVLGILFLPLVILVAFVAWLAFVFFAFSVHWGLGLLALALIAVVVGAFAYWDSHRPPQIRH